MSQPVYILVCSWFNAYQLCCPIVLPSL